MAKPTEPPQHASESTVAKVGKQPTPKWVKFLEQAFNVCEKASFALALYLSVSLLLLAYHHFYVLFGRLKF